MFHKPVIILITTMLALSCAGGRLAGRVIDSEGETGLAPAFASEGKTIAGTYFRNDTKTLMFASSIDAESFWTTRALPSPENMQALSSNRAVLKEETLYSAFYEQRTAGIWIVQIPLDGGPARFRKAADGGKLRFNGLALAVDGEAIHIAYGFDYKLRYARFDLNGSDLPVASAIVDASAVSKGALDPEIVVDRRDVRIAYWGSYDRIGKGTSLELALSKDSGNSWPEANREIIDGPSCSMGSNPAMVVSNGTVAIVYLAKKEVKLARTRGEDPSWEITSLAKNGDKPFLDPVLLTADDGIQPAWRKGAWVFHTRKGAAERLAQVDPTLSIRPNRDWLLFLLSSRRILRFSFDPKAKDLRVMESHF